MTTFDLIRLMSDFEARHGVTRVAAGKRGVSRGYMRDVTGDDDARAQAMARDDYRKARKMERRAQRAARRMEREDAL